MDPDLPIHQSPVDELPPTKSFVHPKPFPYKWALVILIVVIIVTVPVVYLLGQQAASKLAKKMQTLKASKTIAPTPTPNPTSAWKNLSSTADFTFSYPSSWIVKQAGDLKKDPYIFTLGRLSEPLITKYIYETSYVSTNQANFALETFDDINTTNKEALLQDISSDPNSKLFNFLTSSTIVGYNSFATIESNSDNDTEGNIVFKNKLALTIKDNKAYLFVLNYTQPKEEPNPEQDEEMTSTFTKIVSSFKFTQQSSQTEEAIAISPTPITNNWNKYSDSKYNFSFKFPTDWTTQVKDFPQNSQRLVNIIKNSSPSVVSLSFTISNSWANTGNAQNQPKNYSVDGISAFKLDPPQKTDYQLDRYQTNVYFENQGNVYTFVCTHNWDQNYIDTCNNILSSFKFTQ